MENVQLLLIVLVPPVWLKLTVLKVMLAQSMVIVVDPSNVTVPLL